MNEEAKKELIEKSKQDVALAVGIGNEVEVFDGHVAHYVIINLLKRAIKKDIDDNITCYFVENGDIVGYESKDIDKFADRLQKEMQKIADKAEEMLSGSKEVNI